MTLTVIRSGVRETRLEWGTRRRLLVLVRHGAVHDGDVRLWGRSHVTQSAAGQAQSAALAIALAPLVPGRIVASPQRRACETAALCARAAGMLTLVDPRLDEVDFGAWTGRSFAELAPDARWRAWNDRRASARTPGGETMARLTARVLDALEDHADTPAPGPVVLVSHAEIIRAAILEALRIPGDDWWRIRLDPGSMTLLEGPVRPFAVRAVNLRPEDIASHVGPRACAAHRTAGRSVPLQPSSVAQHPLPGLSDP